MIADRNITFDLIERARQIPNEPAFLSDKIKLSFAKLNNAVWRTAQALHDQGLRPSDLVAITFRNQLTLSLAILGLMRIGVTFVLFPRSFTPFQRTSSASALGVTALVSDTKSLYEFGRREITFSVETLRSVTHVHPGILSESPTSECMIVIGSGSTGRPKNIPLKHKHFFHRVRLGWTDPTYQLGARVLSLTDLEFPSIVNALLGTLYSGATFVFRPIANNDLVDFCRTREVTFLNASAFHCERLLMALPEIDRPAIPSLKGIRVASSIITDDLRARIRRRINENLWVPYGTNECMYITRADPSIVYDTSGTVGVPYRNVSVEIVDKSGKLCRTGSVGQVRVKSNASADQYLNDVESSAKAFRDGWFYPGDLGKLMPDGQLVLLGRADQMMIMDGINIYPAEVEQCLTSHPLVRDAAAIPVRHPIHQEIPVCAVCLKLGTSIEPEELVKFARARIGVSAPRSIVTLAEIPRNEFGKVIRRDLATAVARSLGLQVTS